MENYKKKKTGKYMKTCISSRVFLFYHVMWIYKLWGCLYLICLRRAELPCNAGYIHLAFQSKLKYLRNEQFYLYGLWCGIFCCGSQRSIAPHVYDDRHIQCRITVFNIHLINYRFFLQFLDCLCFCYILTVCDIYVLKSKLQRLFDVT